MSPGRTAHTGVAVRRLAAVAGAALVVVATWAAPASAHAQLLSTTPVAGSVVQHSPPQVVLRFGEPVEIDFGSIRVYDAAGARVDLGGTHYASHDDSAVALPLPHLADGAYVVAWRVISADSHPVHGAFIFSVGTSKGLPRASTLATALANAGGSTTVGVAYWLVRLAAFAGLLCLVGIAAITLAAAAPALSSRRIRRWLWASFGLLAVMTIAGVAIQGPYAAALPLTDALRPSLLREVLATRFGRVEALRALLLAIAAPLLVWLTSRRRAASPAPLGVAACAVVGAGLLVTPGLAGHATTGSAIAAGFVLDLAHLAAASLWLGGLVVLACLLVGGATDLGAIDLVRSARRISTIALGAVVVVVVSGTLQAVRQVGSLDALTGTTYGRLLLVKVAVVVVLIALGALSRALLRRPVGAATGDPAPDAPPRRVGLVRSIVAELLVAAAVLGVTAALVNAPPAREQLALPYTQSFTTLGVQVNVILSPAVAGVRNTLHVYVLSPSGTPKAIPEVDATLSYPADQLGPLDVPLTIAGIGHYRSRDVTFLAAGTWVLTVTVRTTPIDEQVTPLQVPVR
ncbi:MAG TPA: copper resistance protein CopC [Acidimicrobiales bacterium]|jgi:copper transport protein|nr:copper resistance protein CopC [Acidimicrobiales bacterium]